MSPTRRPKLRTTLRVPFEAPGKCPVSARQGDEAPGKYLISQRKLTLCVPTSASRAGSRVVRVALCVLPAGTAAALVQKLLLRA